MALGQGPGFLCAYMLNWRFCQCRSGILLVQAAHSMGAVGVGGNHCWRSLELCDDGHLHLAQGSLKPDIWQHWSYKMPEQLQLAATQVDDAPVGMRLLSPAPAYLIIILLLLSMLLNSLVVLVVLPRT